MYSNELAADLMGNTGMNLFSCTYYVDTCVSFHKKIRSYVAYTKMTKCSNDTIMIGCALFTLFTKIGITFMCRSHMAVFLCRNLHK
jgi:hypothetical protein